MTTVNVLDMACAAVASAPGTGTITLGATEPGGFLSWSGAGAVNGQTYGYYIQDGNNRESGFGVYSSTGPTLTRNVTSASVNGVAQGTPINATANAVVSSSVSAATIENISAAITSDVATLQAEINAIHSYITTTVYTSSQTITIPGTIGRIRLVGGGGGANTSSAPIAAGAGGYLEKLLSGLTVGNTVTLTIGAGGTSAPTSGGNSTLVSGTQTITTLTAHGGNTSDGSIGVGGTATNGDINVSGGDGVQIYYSICGSPVVNYAQGGATPLAMPVAMSCICGAVSVAGSGYGGGAAAVSTGGGVSGAAGVCIIDWYV